MRSWIGTTRARYLYVPDYPQGKEAKLNDVHVNTGGVVNTASFLKN